MTKKPTSSTATLLWARFRFSVIGSLLSAPPDRAENSRRPSDRLPKESGLIRSMGRTCSTPPPRSKRWYYKARNEQDDPGAAPCGAPSAKTPARCLLAWELAEHLRSPVPRSSALELPTALRQLGECREGRSFTLGPLCSYSTVKRYMQTRDDAQATAAERLGPERQRAVRRRENREIRSYESEYVGSLWHLDFHHGSLKVTHGTRPVAATDRAGHPG